MWFFYTPGDIRPSSRNRVARLPAPGYVAAMSDTVALLRQVPLLRNLPLAHLERFAERTRVLDVKAEHDIVEIGTPGRCLYLILYGAVRVLYPSQNSDFELARLGPGDFFGEMALLNDKPRSATVRSLDDVRLLTLDKEDFGAVVAQEPRLALELLESMSVRIRNADEQISGLSDQAMEDPLTGLANRRAFRQRMAEEVDRERRYGTPFALVLADIDNFKAVNDTLGHDAGDALLVWVARILSEHTRACDVPCRIGGQEFAVICPANTAVTARVAAERLVGLVGGANTPLQHGANLTISAGYACFPEHARTYQQLYLLADSALSRAKESGRNTAVGADPTLDTTLEVEAEPDDRVSAEPPAETAQGTEEIGL